MTAPNTIAAQALDDVDAATYGYLLQSLSGAPNKIAAAALLQIVLGSAGRRDPVLTVLAVIVAVRLYDSPEVPPASHTAVATAVQRILNTRMPGAPATSSS